MLRPITKMLELAITQVRGLPEEVHGLAADALLIVIEHVNNHDHYHLADERIEGVHPCDGASRSRGIREGSRGQGHLRPIAMKVRVTEDATEDR